MLEIKRNDVSKNDHIYMYPALLATSPIKYARNISLTSSASNHFIYRFSIASKFLGS